VDLGLEASVVLVTGGTDGLGAALARRLVEEGARVAVCGRNADRVDAVRDELTALGGDVEAVSADVTRPEDVEAFVGAAVSRWGRIDGLVNNAGQSAAKPVSDISDDAWTADLDLKVVAAARLVRSVLPWLTQSPHGAIVNTLAIAARTPPGNSLPSSASRAAGLALTKALSKELGPQGIRVNAVLIGLVESGQWRRMAENTGQSEEQVLASLAAGGDIPLGRVGRSDEFADLAAYLLSPRASYVTGSAINLDGGKSPAL
jgi:NAD(P)-dependent dehydrogenase (short-subunit alcohol dehydrogenase family)